MERDSGVTVEDLFVQSRTEPTSNRHATVLLLTNWTSIREMEDPRGRRLGALKLSQSSILPILMAHLRLNSARVFFFLDPNRVNSLFTLSIPSIFDSYEVLRGNNHTM